MNNLPFKLEVSSGSALLDARALWASIVGPQRLAMLQGVSVELFADQPTRLFSNLGAADSYVFLGVSLPANAPVATMRVAISREDTLGANASSPFLLTPAMGGGSFAAAGFMQLLLPGEQIYGQIFDAAFPVGSTQRVVVAAVQF